MESKPSSVRNGITVTKRIRIRPVTTPYPTLIKWSPPCNNPHTQISNAVVKTKTHVEKTSSRSERSSQPVPLSEKLVNKHESRKRETNVKTNDKRKEVSKSEHPTGFAKESKTLKINQEVSTKSGKQLERLLEKTNGVNAPESRIRQSERPIPDIFDRKVKICSTSRSNSDQKSKGQAECKKPKPAITVPLTNVGETKIPSAKDDILGRPTTECKSNHEKLDLSEGGTPDELPENYTLPKSIKCRISRFTKDDVERQITVGQALLSNKNNNSNRNDTTTERKRSPPVKGINALHEDVLNQPPTKRVKTNSYDEQNKYEHRNPFKANQRTSCSLAAINADAFRENFTKTEQSVQQGEGSPRIFERFLDRRINEGNPEIRYTAKYKTLILRKDIPKKAGKIDHSVRQLDPMRYKY
ncbi:unnamed protein product [Hermetia illucens]|uniref:Uncharacterized protein n=1 Tax=Hermetia illucens TaxID=343691 RepID=A0A7R8V135_HERIL|nr:unnamed protein product [Hermetia illucens]